VGQTKFGSDEFVHGIMVTGALMQIIISL